MMDHKREHLLSLTTEQLQQIIGKQEKKILQLKDTSQSKSLQFKKAEYLQTKAQYQEIRRQRHPIISESSSTKHYLTEHFYQEGICDKVDKVIYNMNSVIKNGEGSRSSISSDNGSIDNEEYKKLIQADRNSKMMKEQNKLRAEIKKLEEDVEYEKIYLDKE